MNINQKFFNSIRPVLDELERKIGDEFVVFGSAPLYLLGILSFNNLDELNDLDIAVKDTSRIPKDARQVTFHGNPDQKLYKITINGVEVDIGGVWPGQENYFYKLFENPIVIEGFKFANLDICKEWKERMIRQYDRQKDKEYLTKINEYLAADSAKKMN